jgi:hypothetical protein
MADLYFSITSWVTQQFARLRGLAAPPAKNVAPRTPADGMAPPGSVTPPAPEVPAPVPADPLGELIAAATADADYVFAITAEAVANPANTPLLAEYAVSTTAEGHPVMRLAGGDPAAVSTGRTTGYSIQVSDALELRASGNPIRVRIVARAADAAPHSTFAIAYSTNEVGNTGWRRHSALPEWKIFELNYDVPPMKAGRGDFIGLLPDREGAPGIEVAALCVHVMARAGKSVS